MTDRTQLFALWEHGSGYFLPNQAGHTQSLAAAGQWTEPQANYATRLHASNRYTLVPLTGTPIVILIGPAHSPTSILT